MNRSQTYSSVTRSLWVIAIAAMLLASRPAAAQERAIHNFTANGRDGLNPNAGLIQDETGNFYGTTYGGGSDEGGGTVFELSPLAGGGWKERVLYSFQPNGPAGYNPFASLARDNAGNLYGTTYAGGNGCAYSCGTVFELSPQSGNGWKEAALYNFQGGADGYSPFAGVILDAAGNLYGTTQFGGSQGIGTVFELSPQASGSWKETILHSFQGLDGKEPWANLLFDTNGNLYGTTSEGGSANDGTVFELSRQADGGWKETVIYNFGSSGSLDGGYPVAGLILDSDGNLYGTTAYGGGGGCSGTGDGCGAVFEINHESGGGWSETILHAFQNNHQDGAHPEGALIRDAAGNLFGTTYAGGATTGACYDNEGCGTVFELKPKVGGVWTEKVLHNFDNRRKDGQNPFCNLVFDTTGNLYGTTYIGGTDNFGIVFMLTP